MADPTSYERDYSFSDYQSNNPSQPLPGPRVDNELENIEQAISGLVGAVKDVRRSDGALKNQIVTMDSLHPAVKAGVGQGAVETLEQAHEAAQAAAQSASAAASSAGAAAGSAGTAATSAGQAMGFRNAAQNARDDAITAKNGADTARDYAAQWASAPEGQIVDDGLNPPEHSAYHYAQVALGAATGALPEGSVTTSKIADEAVTEGKLAPAVAGKLNREPPIYDTVASMATVEVPDDVTAIRVNGRNAAGDGEGGLFVGTNNGSTDQFMSQDGRTWYRVRDIALDRFPRDFTHGPKAVKILWLADAQPVSGADIAYWRGVVDQIRTHHADADYLFFIGDLVHRGEPATGDGPYYGFTDFVADMRTIGIPRHRLFYIPGNHDRSYKGATESANGRSMRNYQNAGFEELFYSIRLGNMVFACMGAMSPQTPGDIPDHVVDWWAGIHRQNKDKVLITVTHQPIWNPPYGSAPQMEPERFTGRMTSGECPVDLWFGGHVGGNFTGTEVPPLTDGGGMWEQFGALHVQCGVHLGLGDSAEEQPFGAPSFVVMELANGSDQVTLRRWNCNTQRYQESGPNKTVVKQVRHPVQLAWEPHYDGRHQFDVRNGIRTTANKTFVNVEREEITPGVWGVPAKIQWVHETALEDRYADTMVVGNGVGHIFALPGATTNTESQMRAYGWAGGFSVERTGSQETGNYAGKTTLWSSGAGRGKESLVRSADFTITNWELSAYNAGGDRGWLKGTFDGIEISNSAGTGVAAANARIKVGEVSSGTAAMVSRGNSTAARKHIIFENTNGEVGSISTTNTATAYTTSSDETWKDFIGELAGEDAIAVIKADPARRFDWKPEHGGGSAVGWGAQTSFAVSPDLATPGGWIDVATGEPAEPDAEGAVYRPWGIDQSKRAPYLWAAVSLLVDEISALKARLAALEGASE